MVSLQRQRNLIKPLQQSLPAALIDFEGVLSARRCSDGLRFEIDADPTRSLGSFDLGRQVINNRLVDHDGQDSVLKAVGKKDVANPEPIIARMPISSSDQTAPSREEPQPKFGPVTRICACR